jgi:hypothetical protein
MMLVACATLAALDREDGASLRESPSCIAAAPREATSRSYTTMKMFIVER